MSPFEKPESFLMFIFWRLNYGLSPVTTDGSCYFAAPQLGTPTTTDDFPLYMTSKTVILPDSLGNDILNTVEIQYMSKCSLSILNSEKGAY